MFRDHDDPFAVLAGIDLKGKREVTLPEAVFARDWQLFQLGWFIAGGAPRPAPDCGEPGCTRQDPHIPLEALR